MRLPAPSFVRFWALVIALLIDPLVVYLTMSSAPGVRKPPVMSAPPLLMIPPSVSVNV